jgi:hypothetical protein
MEFNIRDLAEKANLKTYDTALPMDWYDDVYARTGFWPQSYGFVWCYDNPTVWGEPYPLTDAANILLKWYGSLVHTTFRYTRER